AGEESQVDFTNLTGAPKPADGAAHVAVKAPLDAKVTVDGVAFPANGTTVRSFDTPRLEGGRTYYYTVKMEVQRDGRTVSDSRRVLLEAGKDVSVDFQD